MHTDLVRAKLFNVRFSDEEWARMEALCEHFGLNAAGLIRMLLKEKEREVLGHASVPPKAPAPTAPPASRPPPKKRR